VSAGAAATVPAEVVENKTSRGAINDAEIDKNTLLEWSVLMGLLSPRLLNLSLVLAYLLRLSQSL
jgi:hypothetical protein